MNTNFKTNQSLFLTLQNIQILIDIRHNTFKNILKLMYTQ